MNIGAEETAQIRRYLLGDLSEAELLQVEDRLMTEKNFCDKVAILEEELIEDYLGHALTVDELRQFEASFASLPAMHDRIEFVKAVRESALKKTPVIISAAGKKSNIPSQSSNLYAFLRSDLRIPSYGVWVCIIIAIIGVYWLVAIQNKVDQIRTAQNSALSSNEHLSRQIAELEAANAELSQELEAERRQHAETEKQLIAIQEGRKMVDSDQGSKLSTITALLLPGNTRSQGGSRKVVLGSNVTSVQLDLAVPEDRSPRYQATLKNADGLAIWSKDGIRPKERAGRRLASVNIPASYLPPGDYELVLTGAGPDADYAASYYFSIPAK